MNSRALYLAIHGRKAPRKAPGARQSDRQGPARAWRYRNWIRSLPCAVCGAEKDITAAHTEHNGMASKGSDYSCVPLCRVHHHAYDFGLRTKALFEQDFGIDMRRLVKRLNHDWFAYSGRVK